MIFKKSFPFYLQYDPMDCGPCCLAMLAAHYGKDYPLPYLREISYAARDGTSLACLRDAAREIGLTAKCALLSFEELTEKVALPCIVHWQGRHFVVLYAKNRDGSLCIADPAVGKTPLAAGVFRANWEAREGKGYVLLAEPGETFFAKVPPAEPPLKALVLPYLVKYRTPLLRLLFAMLFGSALQLVLPFLTQALIDLGLQPKGAGLLELIVAGQLFLAASRASVHYLRGWLLYHITAPLNLELVRDFLAKLTRLPLRFFEVKMIGDTLQRLGDHQRLEAFLTSSLLGLCLTLVNLVVFGSVLAYYSLPVFALFFAGTALYLIWLRRFLNRRRLLDAERFRQLGRSQGKIIQLIMGMTDVRQNNCEQTLLQSWAETQQELLTLGRGFLAVTQKQQTGLFLLQETQNILITYLSARAVLSGDITIGMMLAIQFIIGQLNGPVEQLLNFVSAAQDAKISLERVGQVRNLPDEEAEDVRKKDAIPQGACLELRNVSFRYGSPYENKALDNVSLTLPGKKTTAIVGASGSGKTTLLKLLLGIYRPSEGEILLGASALSSFSLTAWRKASGAVLQDGCLFSDTIAANIALGQDAADFEKIRMAAKTANIDEFIDSLPLKYLTLVGAEGQGLSQGQRQRLLIARAVFRNPSYLFFDEATNALDAENEERILSNLAAFFKGKTVVIVAHRLSTVKNADGIIVMDKGRVAETGTHEQLLARKGYYYRLVRNQLDLDGESNEGGR